METSIIKLKPCQEFWKGQGPSPEGLIVPADDVYGTAVFPELDRERRYREHNNVVARNEQRNFLINITTDNSGGYPENPEVTFAEVDHPETPFTYATHQQRGGNNYLNLFGQPHFLQSPAYPVHEGKSAYLLARVENDWGDCGNFHIFVALDPQGYPARIWFEANCA